MGSQLAAWVYRFREWTFQLMIAVRPKRITDNDSLRWLQMDNLHLWKNPAANHSIRSVKMMRMYERNLIKISVVNDGFGFD